jgi:tight adherence protein C
MVGAMLLLSFRLPNLFLERRIKARAEQTDREIPDFIELMAITIEAGLGFEQAAQATISRMEGPIHDEFALMLQEVRMGVARDEAMQHVVDRIDSRNLRVLVRALTQGQALGVPLGQILKDLCLDMRIRRRQAAEEKAQQAPVKMAFPTVLLIFPSLLIILLGPAVFRFADAFLK